MIPSGAVVHLGVQGRAVGVVQIAVTVGVLVARVAQAVAVHVALAGVGGQGAVVHVIQDPVVVVVGVDTVGQLVPVGVREVLVRGPVAVVLEAVALLGLRLVADADLLAVLARGEPHTASEVPGDQALRRGHVLVDVAVAVLVLAVALLRGRDGPLTGAQAIGGAGPLARAAPELVLVPAGRRAARLGVLGRALAGAVRGDALEGEAPLDGLRLLAEEARGTVRVRGAGAAAVCALGAQAHAPVLAGREALGALRTRGAGAADPEMPGEADEHGIRAGVDLDTVPALGTLLEAGLGADLTVGAVHAPALEAVVGAITGAAEAALDQAEPGVGAADLVGPGDRVEGTDGDVPAPRIHGLRVHHGVDGAPPDVLAGARRVLAVAARGRPRGAPADQRRGDEESSEPSHGSPRSNAFVAVYNTAYPQENQSPAS